MSVINKMLRDLDKRGAATARGDASESGARAAPPAAQRTGRWKLAAWLLVIPVAIAAGWFATRPAPHAPEVDAGTQKAAPKAPLTVAQTSATPKVAPSQPEAPARVAKEDPKGTARTDSAISNTKREPAAAPRAAPEKPAAKAPAPAQEAKPAATAERGTSSLALRWSLLLGWAKPAAPAERGTRESASVAASAATAVAPEAKGSISFEQQDRDSARADPAAVEYRSAVDLMNQGRVELATDAYAGVLRLDPRHAAARQALVALLMGRGRLAEAQGVLREGLKVLPENSASAMLLARLQVEAGDTAGAMETLNAALPHAKNLPDYHAFAGTVLQMQGRHREAIAHYEISVRLAPESGRSLTGLAISLEEEKRLPEAREAYQRALATATLGPPELRTFVERKLAQLR